MAQNPALKALEPLLRSLDAGDAPEACQRIEQLCSEHPQDADACYAMGVVELKRGRLEAALAQLRKVLQARPGHVRAAGAMAQAYLGKRDPDRAADILRRCIEANPDVAELHNDLGNVLRRRRSLEEAAACFRRAIELDPALAAAHSNLGSVLGMLGQAVEAEASQRRAVELRPDMPGVHSNLLVSLNYLPEQTLGSLLDAHRGWGRKHADPLPRYPGFDNVREPDRALRIGYISPDLRNHPVAYFLVQALANRTPGHSEVFCYSAVPTPDKVTGYFRSLVSGWRNIANLDHARTAELIHGDRIDILVDLAGHSNGNRLLALARKPAPVQVTYLGYPMSSGMDAVDYRITDAVIDPPQEACWYPETLMRLKGGFSCYAPPGDAPPVAPLPAQRNGVVTFGSLSNLRKINATVLALWSEVLRANPRTRLLIFRDTLTAHAVERMRAVFVSHGIAPERVRFERSVPGGGALLRVYEAVDIVLDTFPWNGHTTSCEALWMGVPVVTLRGQTPAGRIAASVLVQAGLSDMVAETEQDYIRIAGELAADTARLAHIRSSMRERLRASRLCDGAAFAAELNETFRAMWRRWCGQ